ncbi:TatD family hydrolase [Humidisolicoccus flavus]|uniref:TatD family hydrolase n=1 Tax=Humidisolicoccus flavus TaxID=3111414 RepID=UPI0032431536
MSNAHARPPVPPPLGVSVYDNHTHMELRDNEESDPFDWKAQLESAELAGVAGVVQVGTDLPSSQWAAEIANTDPRVLAAVALHPNEAPILGARGVLAEHLEGIAALAAHERVRAIGETGLDYFRTGEDGRAFQHESFEAHIAIAKAHDLALQIHDRDAHDEVVETLRRVGAPERTVFHCFSGDAELARIAAEEGWYLSFSGTVTFKNAKNLHEAVQIVPLDRILVETDAPFLTPTPFRGRPNSAYMVPYTVRSIAERLAIAEDELAAATAENTIRVYGSWSAA